MLTDLSRISKVTLDSLLLPVLPDLGSSLDQVFSALVHCAHISNESGWPQWICSAVGPALNELGDEILAFTPLSAIFDTIKAIARLDSSQF